MPPACKSMGFPKIALAITEHSICHPGLPSPQGLGHLGSSGLLAFQRAKSLGLFFSDYLFAYDSPSPSYNKSAFVSGLILGYVCPSAKYFCTSKYTLPLLS